MRPTTAALVFVSIVLAVIVGSAPSPRAHEGHDHGAPLPPVTKTIAPRADASSDEFEVVVVAREQTLTLHLDRFRSNEPVDGAEIEIDSPSGVLKPVPIAKEPGSYAVAAPFLAKPGKYDLAITVTVKDTVDILATTLTLPDAPLATSQFPGTSWISNPAVAQDLKRHLFEAPAATWLYVLFGFVSGALLTRVLWPRRVAKQTVSACAGLLLAVATLGSARADGVAVAGGRDIAQRFPDGAVFVPKPTQRILAIRTIFTEEREHRRTVELPGRIVPSPNASGLIQASVGGRLFPPEGGFKPLGTRIKAGDVLAYVRPPLPLADATTQAQQARELDQQISIATRKVERLRAIQHVVARSQLEDAELELNGLLSRRRGLDRVKSEPEALVSPVDGVLAAANAVAGQMAEPNAVIFHIIDPDRLWIEALSYDAQALVGSARGQLPDGRTIELAHVGTGFADRNQAIPVHFSIAGGSSGLRAGQFLTVLAATADVRRGIAVPREAVLRGSNGQSLVFEHSNAERFVPREVRVEPLDGSHMLIIAGVERGRRVVTQGAELLNQIR